MSPIIELGDWLVVENIYEGTDRLTTRVPCALHQHLGPTAPGWCKINVRLSLRLLNYPTVSFYSNTDPVLPEPCPANCTQEPVTRRGPPTRTICEPGDSAGLSECPSYSALLPLAARCGHDKATATSDLEPGHRGTTHGLAYF